MRYRKAFIAVALTFSAATATAADLLIVVSDSLPDATMAKLDDRIRDAVRSNKEQGRTLILVKGAEHRVVGRLRLPHAGGAASRLRSVSTDLKAIQNGLRKRGEGSRQDCGLERLRATVSALGTDLSDVFLLGDPRYTASTPNGRPAFFATVSGWVPSDGSLSHPRSQNPLRISRGRRLSGEVRIHVVDHDFDRWGELEARAFARYLALATRTLIGGTYIGHSSEIPDLLRAPVAGNAPEVGEPRSDGVGMYLHVAGDDATQLKFRSIDEGTTEGPLMGTSSLPQASDSEGGHKTVADSARHDAPTAASGLSGPVSASAHAQPPRESGGRLIPESQQSVAPQRESITEGPDDAHSAPQETPSSRDDGNLEVNDETPPADEDETGSTQTKLDESPETNTVPVEKQAPTSATDSPQATTREAERAGERPLPPGDVEKFLQRTPPGRTRIAWSACPHAKLSVPNTTALAQSPRRLEVSALPDKDGTINVAVTGAHDRMDLHVYVCSNANGQILRGEVTVPRTDLAPPTMTLILTLKPLGAR